MTLIATMIIVGGTFWLIAIMNRPLGDSANDGKLRELYAKGVVVIGVVVLVITLFLKYAF